MSKEAGTHVMLWMPPASLSLTVNCKAELSQVVLFSVLKLIITFFFFWPCPQHVEVPGPGIEPTPQL